ncbi:MAG: M48 family metallopeptidase, partial [Tannerella sp.]|nr:M48 family metallopeptidase [Tannerella sp.]
LFRKNNRARKYIIRINSTATIIVTVPIGGSFREAEKFFNESRDLLIKKAESVKKKRMNAVNQQQQYDESELRKRAKAFLPEETLRLASEYGFSYKGLKIRKSKTRWGSCSSRKIINLSFYVMILPRQLIEYVILHELCHTIQMNHSPAFWALLDKCTNGKAKQLRKELRKYSVFVFN